MIVLDTTIWVEYLKNNQPYHDEVSQLIKEDSVIALDIIFGELLYGAFEEEFAIINALWDNLRHIENNNNLLKGGLYSYHNKIRNFGIGLIDAAIINATISNDAKLWTLDKKILKYLDDKYLF